MKEFLLTVFWYLAAKVLSLPLISDYLILRAKRTPYRHLNGYMLRWWLVPEREGSDFAVRIHHILRRDNDRHPHNHPWAFRSIILRGWYVEEYLDDLGIEQRRTVKRGDTYVAPHGHFHRIVEISPGGVRTLCIFHRRQSYWGFMQDGKFVPADVYLGRESSHKPQPGIGQKWLPDGRVETSV